MTENCPLLVKVPGDVTPSSADPLSCIRRLLHHHLGGFLFFLPCLCLSLLFLGSLLLLLLDLTLLTCHSPRPHEVDLTSGSHPVTPPLPGPVNLVLLPVGPRVKHSSSHLHSALSSHVSYVSSPTVSDGLLLFL